MITMPSCSLGISFAQNYKTPKLNGVKEGGADGESFYSVVNQEQKNLVQWFVGRKASDSRVDSTEKTVF